VLSDRNWQYQNGQGNPDGKPWGPKWLVDCLGLDYFGNVVRVDYLGADAGLVHVGRLTGLEELVLGGSQVSDDGLVHLKGLTRLKGLDLRDTRITDQGLVHLQGLPNLERIDITGLPITDAGLVHLKGLTSLRGCTRSFFVGWVQPTNC
jgi:hypothetical protein